MIKVLVSIKRVVDFSLKIRVKTDHSGVETSNLKMSINPFDEIALEEAIRLKEQGVANETVAVSIGPEGCQESLRSALAMGIDRATHIKTEAIWEPINIAKILREIARQEKPDLILLGKQAIDDDCNQTGQMLAALLGWPQGTFASRLVVHPQTIEITREIDGGLEILALNLPALVTTDLRLNKPRYPSLPNIMKAKQKPLNTVLLESLSLDLKPHMIIKEVKPPPKKKGGMKVDSVQELIAKLHEEARVI
jgi:electron transfer flavoprotein beta subunit